MERHPDLRPSVRDAPDLIGGLNYQKLVTLIAWLDLRAGEVLHIEKQEDLAVSRTGSAEVIQVRRTRAPISLNSAVAHQIIQYAFDREPEVITVYWSTSDIRQERQLRQTGLYGIDLWAKAADGDRAASQSLQQLLLKRGGWSADLEALLRSGPHEALQERLFRRLRWDLKRPSARLLEAQAKARLQGRVSSLRQGRASLAKVVLPDCLAEIERVAVLPFEQRGQDSVDLDSLIERSIALVDSVASLNDVAGLGRRGSLSQLASQAEDALASACDVQLTRARELLAGGKIRGAILLLEDWLRREVAQPPARAAAVRLKAEATLALGDAHGAGRLAEEAEAIDQETDPRLDLAILALEDPESALEQLGAVPEFVWQRAELLMRLGQSPSGLALIEALPADRDGPYEGRVRATLLASSGDLEAALKTIAPLRSRYPDVELILAAATFHYALGQAKGATIAISDWPSPTSPGLVRSSEKARRHLRDAAALFAQAEQALDDDRFKADKAVWRLACLVDLPEEREAAGGLARQLVSGTAPHAGAVHWALRRNLSIDLPAVEAAFAARADTASGEDLVAYGLLLHQREADAIAIEILKAQSPRLDSADRQLVEGWIQRLRGVETPEGVAQALVQAQACGAWNEVEALAASDDRSVEERFTLLQILASENQWPLVARHITFLEKLRTVEGVRLATYASVNTGDHPQVVALTEEPAEVFAAGTLPDDLLGIRIEALAAIGRLPEAFSLLEGWAPQSAGGARMTELRLRLNIGDLEGVASRATELRLEQLPPDERLRIASQIAPAAPSEARALLRTVDFAATSIALASVAYEAAEMVRLDRHLRKSIASRMFSPEAQDAGVVVAVSMEEVLELVRGDDARSPDDLYEKGDAPLHRVLDQRLGRAFGRLLTGEGDRPDLYTRDASAVQAEPVTARTIRLDVTALLTAHALGLLDPICAAFERVEVSQHLALALQLIERDVHMAQPERLQAMEEVLGAIDSTPGLADVPPAAAAKLDFIGGDGDLACGDVVDALSAAGLIPAAHAAAAQESLGREGAPKGCCPAAGAPLRLDASVGVLLAEADLLETARSHWRLVIDADSVPPLQSEVEGRRFDAKVEQQVRELRRRLMSDLRTGRIGALSVQDSEPGSIMIETVRDLARTGEDVAVWIEDRAMHLRRPLEHGAAIVTAHDILAHLEKTHTLSSAEATEARRRLREGGFRFQPMEEGEVLALLQAAPIRRGRLIETAELGALRRAFARDLLSERVLRIAIDPKTRTAETTFLMSASRRFDQLLKAIWNARGPIPGKRAWSDWVWENLRAERLDRTPIAGPSEEGRSAIHLLNVASRLDMGVMAGRNDKEKAAVLQWVWDRVVFPELEADPSLETTLPAQFAALWTSLFVGEDGRRGRETSASRRARGQLCAGQLALMPEPMRELLLENPDVRDLVGFALKRRLSFDDFAFDADPVLRAIQEAYRSRRSHTVTSGGERLRITREQDAVRIRRNDKPEIVIGGDTLALVVGDESQRKAAIKRGLTALDVEPKQAAKQAAMLAAIPDPYRRLTTLGDVQEATVPGRLDMLERLTRLPGVKLSALDIPPPEALRRWLRCDTGARPGVDDLLAFGREGLERLAGMPLALWSDACERWSPTETRAFAAAPAWTRSPCGDLLALSVLARSDASADLLPRSVSDVLIRLEAEGDRFVDLVTQVQRAADRNVAWRSEDPAFFAAATWAWADQVWRVFAAAGRDPGALAEHWRKADSPRPRDLVTMSRWTCAMSAPSISIARLAATGLAFALGDRREDMPSDIGEKISKWALAAARGGRPMGPLTQAPDADLTWLSAASPYIWNVDSDGVQAAAQSAVDAYPDQPEELALAIVGGPDTLDADLAARLLKKMAEDETLASRMDRLIGELKLVSLVVRTLARRDELTDERWDLAVTVSDGILRLMKTRTDWSRISEAVFHQILTDASVGDADRIARRIGQLSRTATGADRAFLKRAADVFLHTMPFSERVPIWDVRLRMLAEEF